MFFIKRINGFLQKIEFKAVTYFNKKQALSMSFFLFSIWLTLLL